MRKKIFDMPSYCAQLEAHLGGQEGKAKPFWKALSFAVEAHSGQKRKSGEAYVSHPCEVARILVEEFGVDDPETLAAAILHDTVEDVPEVTNEVIGEVFGRDIEAIVDGCTKVTDFTGNRQQFYSQVHKKLFSGAASRVEVMLIKLADRLHNLRTMGSMPKHKRQKIADETLSVYAPMAKVMGLFELKRELYNLALENKFPRQSQKLLAYIKKIVSSEDVADIRDKIQSELEQAWITADIYVVPKGLWTYFDETERILRKEIETPVEIIISSRDVQSCYRTMGVVNLLFPPIPRTIRDFIANPKPTGYQSLHARANIKGANYLFKFRTDQMYQIGRTGIVRMWLDHRTVPSDFENEIQELFGILSSEEGSSYREIIAARVQKEIFTFTPRGDRVCLPKQSSVLDFAFKVHTEVGRRCYAAIVSGKRVGPEYMLVDGDRVQILTQDDLVRFEPEAKEFCKSPKARAELSKMFRYRRRTLARRIGKSLLAQEFKYHGIPLDVMRRISFENLLEKMDIEDTDDLYLRIGEGGLNLRSIMSEVRQKVCPELPIMQPPSGALNHFFLDSLDPVCIKFSQCCEPNPTEKALMGLLSERGLSVHKKDCRTLKTLTLQREDVVELRWQLKKTRVHKAQALLVTHGDVRNRIFMLIGVAPEEMRVLEVIALSPLPNGKTAWEIDFEVQSLQDLKKTLAHFDKAGLQYEFFLDQ